jgi:UDPglucose 6-dehydrogenase
MAEARALLPPDILYCADLEEATTGADATLLLTEWAVYRALDPVALKARMRGNLFLDLRNCFPRARMEEAGFTYIGVGR